MTSALNATARLARGRSRRAVIMAAMLVASLSACGGALRSGTGNSRVLSREELEAPAVAFLSLYEAIERLRPDWLQERGASSVMAGGRRLPVALINNAIQQLEGLRSIRAADVESARYLDPRDATTRFGTGYPNGIIEVTGRFR